MNPRLAALISSAIVAGSLLLASCSTAPTSPTQPTESPAAAKPYGTLTIGWDFNITADMLNFGVTYYSMGSAIYESLTRLTTDGQTAPSLAERWEISPDGKTHTYYVRKGVRFHDGSPLTGADVKFTFERIMGPKATYTGGERADWLRAIDKVELKDDYTVVLHMKTPRYVPVEGIDPPNAGAAVVSKKYVETNGEDYLMSHPMGTGPWRAVKYETQLRLDLEAVEDHWRVVPKFKNLSVLFVPEEGTRVAMLKTGELDIGTVAVDSVEGVKAAGLRVQGHDGMSQFFAFLSWDRNNPQLQTLGNIKLRKALSLSINRKELADTLFRGYAEPSVLFFANPNATYWDANVLKPDPYDPDQAKRLMAEAGYPNGFTTKIWDVGAGGIASTLVQAIATTWRKIGVNAEIEPVAYIFIRQTSEQSDRRFNSMWFTVSGGGVWQFERIPSSYRSAPTKSINNPKLDDIIDKIPLTADPKERERMKLEAVKLSRDEYYALSVLDIKTLFAFGSKVGEVKPIKGGSALWGPVYAEITHAK